MITGPKTSNSNNFGRATARAACLFGLWLVVTGGAPANFGIGLLIAATATWASIRLMPLSDLSWNLLILAKIALRAALQAFVGGLDVARRALGRRLKLSPGVIEYRTEMPDAASLGAFALLSGISPGSAPFASSKHGELMFHCLDIESEQLMRRRLRSDETLLRKALGLEPSHV